MKTKESEICLAFKIPTDFKKDPWVLGLLYHPIRDRGKECVTFGETKA